jgi:hypothetical protein
MHPSTEAHELVRLPGLYRRWELIQILQPDCDYHVEDAGETSDGTRLLAVYLNRPIPTSEAEPPL